MYCIRRYYGNKIILFIIFTLLDINTHTYFLYGFLSSVTKSSFNQPLNLAPFQINVNTKVNHD